MKNIIRIIFTILACISVVVSFFIGVWFDLVPALICLGCGALCFGVVWLMKWIQKREEQAALPPKGDFLNPVPKTPSDEKKDS